MLNYMIIALIIKYSMQLLDNIRKKYFIGIYD